MGWLRRWDRRNSEWAERARRQQDEPPPPPGLGDRMLSAYVTYKFVTWAVVAAAAAIALVVRLVT